MVKIETTPQSTGKTVIQKTVIDGIEKYVIYMMMDDGSLGAGGAWNETFKESKKRAKKLEQEFIDEQEKKISYYDSDGDHIVDKDDKCGLFQTFFKHFKNKK